MSPLSPLLLLLLLGAGSAELRGSALAVSRPGRYSEATLASDYSRTMDSVLSKNFVEWLLARRERSAGDPADLEKLEKLEKRNLGIPGAKEFLSRLWENREQQSFPALDGSKDFPKEFLEQEFLTWLMSGELCRATTS